MIFARYILIGSICAGALLQIGRGSGEGILSRVSEEAVLRQLIAKYAMSIDDADTVLASQIWSHSPEVSFFHPLGRERGFEQIKQNFYLRLMDTTFSARQLNIHDASISVYGDAAWAEFYWDFTGKFRKDGSIITTKGQETQIYHKEAGGWRLVHVHYSGMPVTEQKQGF
jgi:ketosteroid isomerase-like protein